MRKPRERILHVIGGLVAGGAERSSKDLALAMKRAGHPVEYVSITNRRDDVGESWAAQLRDEGIPIHVGPSPSLRASTVWWLRCVLSRPDVRIVHLHLDYTEKAYFLSRFLHRRRYGILRKIHNTKLPTGFRRWVMDHSDVKVYYSCGEVAHEAYRGHVRGEQLLIPNGLLFDWERNEVAKRGERKRLLGVDPEKTHFFHAGRFTADEGPMSQKAQAHLIDAWKRADMGKRGAMLQFLGTGPGLESHRARASDDGSIVFHGVVANVKGWLACADAFVLPSRWEGLPLGGVEAVASGIPCIFSDIKPNRELGSTVASYFEVGDVPRLSELLVERLEHPIEASEEDVAAMRDRWGIDRPMKMFLALYDRLMPAPAGRASITAGEAPCRS